jgi:protein-S-isoprenylcysteine O-methyltransferase Ste14
VQLGVLAGVSVVAWVAYSIATAMLPAEPDFAQALTVDALSATVVEGLTAAAVSILPLGFLEGRELFQHSKRLWLGVFIGLALLFSLLVLPIASNASGPADWLVWGIVLIGFAAITLIVWAIFQFTGRHDDPHEEDENAVSFDQAEAR